MTLKQIKQEVYKYSVHTKPEVKFSQNNFLVAKIAEAIDDLIKHRKQKRKMKKS